MKRRASRDLSPKGSTKRKAVSDDGSSDDEDNSMDMSQNPGFNVDKEAESGIIEKVSLKNFMCHNWLDVQLGTNINFIVGRNGSGKSAVVTALVVGLGGKAATTNRGSKLRGFIKTGKHSAEVEIRLRNRGTDSYKPELYGDSIVVQRQFRSDGSTQYKLKSKDGKLVSQKKDDLMRILDQFNIQVDNPIAILNQDTSRNFLNSKSPQDKYKFFLKATQLEQIQEDCTTANEQKGITSDIIQQKKLTLPKLETEVLAWEQKFKSLTAVEELKAKTVKLRSEMAWAFVIEKEKGMQPLVKEARQEEARLPRFKQKAEEAKVSLDTINKTMTDLTGKLNSSGEVVRSLQPALEEAKKALKEQKTLARNAQNEVKRIESAVNRTTKERDSIEEKIQELQSSARHDYESEQLARQSKIENLQEQLNSVQAQETTTDHQLDQFRNAITKYKNDLYKIGQDAQHSQTQLEKQQRNLHVLQASQGNRLKRFGAFMPQLVQKIEDLTNKGRFHKKPLGPLGAYMTLKDQKWALAVECCLKGLIQSFMCHDFHDEKLLEQIITETCPPYYKPSIIVSKFKDRVYNVSEKQAQSNRYKTIMNVIHSDHPMVFNTLIDQRTIECVVLIEDGREARQVMDPDSQPGPPRNAREAFTLRGDQVYSAPTFRYYSSNQDKVKFLTASVEEDIATTTADINRLKQVRMQFDQHRRQLDKEVQQNKTEERRTETQLMKTRERKRKLTMEITDLRNIEDPAPVDVATYEEEKRLLEGQLTQLWQQQECKHTVWHELDAKLKDQDDKFKQIENEMRAKIEAGDGIKEEVSNVVNKIETCKGAKKHYDAKLKEQDKKVKDLQSKLEKYKADIESDIEKAVHIHEERINTRRTPVNLESEINQINKQIRNEEKQRGDPDEITQQYREKKDSYVKIVKEVKQLQYFIKRLSHVMSVRMDKFKELRRLIAMRAKYFFILMLNNRQYTGKLKFNHMEESLEMSVQPSQSAASTVEGPKDLKSLSGGERSFSTVCFILSLWEATESPFRCLDEFDVFMDMVNRRISMDMMLEAAYSQGERQFIFLSPQNMSNINIKDSRRVKIFKMPTPERGQTTLAFGDRNEEEEET